MSKISTQQQKKRNQRVAELHEKLREIRDRPEKRKMILVEPEYDEDFWRIQELLNEEGEE